MKTLDEVIKANECCDHGEPDSRCEDCPYNGVGACCAERETDALHYLKEYRETKRHLACLDDAEIRGDNTQVVNNPPLTWDELRKMVGKPVWVEDNIDEPEDLTKYWAIYRRIEKAQETEYALLSDFYYDKAQYGKIWQAYRKERE